MDITQKYLKNCERLIDMQEVQIAEQEAEIQRLERELAHLNHEKNISPQWPPNYPWSTGWPHTQKDPWEFPTVTYSDTESGTTAKVVYDIKEPENEKEKEA